MVSMKDVALAAGVSQPAVSYAYNKPNKLSAAQREHILAVAEKLGYPGPNIMGRSLRSGKVGAIGLMVMDKLSYAFADPSMIALMRGIGEIGELSNVALTLFPLNNRRIPSDDGKSGNTSLAVRGLVDGLIIPTMPDDHPMVRAVIQQKIPFVVVDSPMIEGAHYVGINDRGAARQQMRHLLDLGHRRVGIVVDRLNPDNHRGEVDLKRFRSSTEMIVRERLTGYIEEAAEAGLAFEDLHIVEAGGFDSTAGQAAAASLLNKYPLTAIVACSDVMALASMSAAQALQMRVPEDISIIGFDDIPEAGAAGLTTIRQPLVEKGVYAARFLVDLLNSPPAESEPPKRKIFQTQLVVRTSTQKPD
ncbi:LacI family DNA-binding transcriptional regulator [Pseudomonas sp. MOB-449]|nr:LacI family DNA-binding transcriptional regulator [Pseudomonas sp. MOB-449]